MWNADVYTESVKRKEWATRSLAFIAGVWKSNGGERLWGGGRSIMWNSKKTFQQTGFNLLTMKQTGLDLKRLPGARGPPLLIAPLCEQAKSSAEGKFSPELVSCCTYITQQRHGKARRKPYLFQSLVGTWPFISRALNAHITHVASKTPKWNQHREKKIT